MTADHTPHVHEPGPGALVYLGCNGRGVALADRDGTALAKRLIGARWPEIEMPITTLKADPFHALWPVAVKGRRALRPNSRSPRALARPFISIAPGPPAAFTCAPV